ncbi:MAG: hypothetical protein JEZ03_18400, partial [Bacteroidales bacterium]|nr:hypothetical protein [Bacteroidales bacterium]
CGDPLIDPRDGQIYTTVEIGTQCWMAENLNIGSMINGNSNMTNNSVIEKYCYDNVAANCEIYGGLYQWNEMMQYVTSKGTQGICPGGWHLPTDDEWKILEGNVDSQYPVGDPVWNQTGHRGFDAGLNLKSTTGWYGGGNGSGLFNYEALPGGYRYYNGGFDFLTRYASFWSSSEVDSSSAWYRNLSFNRDEVYRGDYYKLFGYSVRCLMGEYINQPPELPSSPNPEDGAINLSIETDLSWTCTDPENDPLTYDIYFGTEATPPQVTTCQTEITYDPGTLENNTEYFWKIVAHDDHENTTEGNIWSFTTRQWQCGDPFTDSRDQQIYNSVQIDNQCWMAENLAYLPSVSPSSNGSNTDPYYYVYDYQGTTVAEAKATSNYETYGVLYNWSAAIISCPSGWHLPSDNEWKILEGTVDSQYPVGDPIWNTTGWRGYDAGLNLKSTSGWDSGGNGTNDFGFTLLPSGWRGVNTFEGMGNFNLLWTSTQQSATLAQLRFLSYEMDNIYRYYYLINKYAGGSVRCLKD